jgi:hypothetical protein
MAMLYSILAVMGTVLPFAKFVPWLAEHGPDLPLFFGELFSTRIGGFFGIDVFVSAVTLIVFIRREGKRAKIRHRWLPVVATCLIGVSCGLPLFLYLRERHRNSKQASQRTPRETTPPESSRSLRRWYYPAPPRHPFTSMPINRILRLNIISQGE